MNIKKILKDEYVNASEGKVLNVEIFQHKMLSKEISVMNKALAEYRAECRKACNALYVVETSGSYGYSEHIKELNTLIAYYNSEVKYLMERLDNVRGRLNAIEVRLHNGELRVNDKCSVGYNYSLSKT